MLADKGYRSKAIRGEPRRRTIGHTMPERDDQQADRTQRGSAGGRPPIFDTERYTNRDVVERFFNPLKQWRALATRYTKRAHYYRNDSPSQRSSPDSEIHETLPRATSWGRAVPLGAPAPWPAPTTTIDWGGPSPEEDAFYQFVLYVTLGGAGVRAVLWGCTVAGPTDCEPLVAGRIRHGLIG